MSDDIVIQLRDRDAVHSIACGTSEHWSNAQCVRCVAADEIERLRYSVAEVDKLRQRISELEDRVSDLEQSHD